MSDRRPAYTYSSFDEDVVVNPGQDYRLPEDYQWVREGFPARLRYRCAYSLVTLLGLPYLRLRMKAKVSGGDKVKAVPKGQGIFIYCNHTMEVGDVILPAALSGGRRCWTVVSESNFGLPGIGPLLPWVGALPTGRSASDAKRLSEAVASRSARGGCICIFPEAHLWPYYTEIRPFGSAPFHYPAVLGTPCFAACTTYRRPRHGRRPDVRIILDGPFYPDMSLGLRERKEELMRRVRESLERSAASSDFRYARYNRTGHTPQSNGRQEL